MKKSATKRIEDKQLSTLEMTVLGIAWMRGPCTIYTIMQELSRSASTFHKSRAGTAYSVANRLLEFGLLETLPCPEGDKQVRLSEMGAQTLRTWFDLPIPEADVAHTADLLRLRFFFIEIVELDQRLEFIKGARQELEKLLSRCEALVAKNQDHGDFYGALAMLSILYETRARIQWLDTVQAWINSPPDPSLDWTKLALERLH